MEDSTNKTPSSPLSPGVKNEDSSTSSSTSSVSEEEGFVSGEEEFDNSSERVVVDSSEDPFKSSSEIPKPVVVSEVLGEGGIEKVDKSGVLEGQKGVEGDSGGLGSIDGVSGDLKGGVNEGLEGTDEILASVGNPSGAENNEVVNAEVDDSVTGEKGVEEGEVKDEGARGSEVIDDAREAKEVEEVVEGNAAQGNHAVEFNGDKVKPVETDERVEVHNGLKHTPEGDSFVDAINVDAKGPGVAVVEDVKQVSEEEVKPVEAKVLEFQDEVKLTSEGDSVVDVKEPGVAVVGETTENEAAKVKERELPVVAGAALVSTDDSESNVVEDAVAVKNLDVVNPSNEPATHDDVEKPEPKTLQPIDNAAEAGKSEKVDIGGTVNASGIKNEPETVDNKENGNIPKEIEQLDASEVKENGIAMRSVNNGEILDLDNGLFDGDSGKSHELELESGQQTSMMSEVENGATNQVEEDADLDGSISDEDTDGMIFGSSEAAKQFIEELERGSGAESSRDDSQRIDGQIVTDSDEEVDTDDEGEGKELFDSAALAALLKAATGADADGGGITITSQDGSRLFSVERPAGLGSSLRSLRPTPAPARPNIFAPSTLSNSGDAEINLTDEEKKKLEKLQQIRVKFLRLVHRLSLSPDESVGAQVLYRLALVAGRQGGQVYSIDAAKRMALQLEAEKKDDLDFSVNILVLGKCGVGKSATINSIFGEEKALIDAFQPTTSTVKEIIGYLDGVKLRVFDTPGLKCSVMDQAYNRSILASVKKFTKKTPPDIVLYVDRLDTQSRDLNDLPLLKTITSSLGQSIWRNAIVTLTHASSAPPDGPSGSPLSYEVFVSQRSHVVQQSIGHAVGDLRMMSPSLMNPVSLVENHPSCRKNRGQKVLPNGQTWRPQLLMLCYSMKILSEANSLSKPQDPFDHRKLFGFRVRSPPLPYMLSSMLQSRAHPKLSAELGGDNGDSDIDLDDLSDIEEDEEDEYDQLPPFKPLRRVQIAKLSKEQRKAYFEEYDYRVKLLQKKQWKEELRRMKEMKKKGKDASVEYGFMEEDADSGAAAPVAVPLPDMVLPPSFDGDNPAYRYRYLEPTSQFIARPVLDTHGWDHDCGYDGVNVEQNLAIAGCFPAVVTVQVTKDKKDFTISLDSSVSAKHGENGSSMAGFDIQNIGRQLAYIVRGETKFKNWKKNKTTGGISVTFLGENVVPGVKIEDQITLGKQYVLVGSAGAVRAQNDTAYGANFEIQRREADFPIGQVQSTISMSVIKWRSDLALGFNSLAQFNVGRSSKVAVRAGINNKLSGQITVRTSSSDHLSLALAAIIPTAISVYKKLWPSVSEKLSAY